MGTGKSPALCVGWHACLCICSVWVLIFDTCSSLLLAGPTDGNSGSLAMDSQVKNPWVPQSNGFGIPLTSEIQKAKVAITLIRGYALSLYFNCGFGLGQSLCLET